MCCVCWQAVASKQEQEISCLVSEVSRLQDVRTQHETSIQHLQDNVDRSVMLVVLGLVLGLEGQVLGLETRVYLCSAYTWP